MVKINVYEPEIQAAAIIAAAQIAANIYVPGGSSAEKVAIIARDLLEQLSLSNKSDAQIAEVSIG